MFHKIICSGIILSVFSLLITLCAQDDTSISRWIPTPEEAKKKPVNVMQRWGEKADFHLNRIRFKISYSFYKSREYFRLAASSPRDAVPKHTRDLKSRLKAKQEDFGKQFSDFRKEAQQKGEEQIRKGVDQISKGFERQKDAVSEHLQKAGKEFRKEAQKEFNKQTDGLFK